MRRVVREIGIPAGRSVAQLQSPVACCRIRRTPVDVRGANPPPSPVTFGILTVTPMFPFLSFLACLYFRGCVSLLPPPPPLTRPPLCVSKAAMFLTSFLLCWMFMLSKQQVRSVSPTFTLLPRHGSWFSAQLEILGDLRGASAEPVLFPLQLSLFVRTLCFFGEDFSGTCLYSLPLAGPYTSNYIKGSLYA